MSLVIISTWYIMLGWSCSFIVISILSIHESVCYFNQFWHRSGFDSSQLFNKVRTAKPKCKAIYCSLIIDVFCWIFYYTPALYIWAQRLANFLCTRFNFFYWRWSRICWTEIACELISSSP
jgi:hypothetical protein